MKWPFVSRGYHERRIESYHQDLNVAIHRVEAAERREQESAKWHRAALDLKDAKYDALLDKYHALRVSGANQPAPMDDLKPDPVVEAIKERSNGNPRLERHLMREAAKLKLRQKTDDEIIHAVTEWRDPSAEESA